MVAWHPFDRREQAMEGSFPGKAAPNVPANEAVVIEAIRYARSLASPSDPSSDPTTPDPQSREVTFRTLHHGTRQTRARREVALRRRRAYDLTLARGEPAPELRRQTDLRA